MASPISIFLRELRLRSGLTQLQLARLLGYEQGYMSAIELGTKSPSSEFLRRLASAMELSEMDRREMDLALKQSRRRFTLPVDASTQSYLFCNELWDKIERLYPAQLQAMNALLKMDDQMAERPRYQPSRIRRRSKVETTM